MTTGQTLSADEDHWMWSKAPEQLKERLFSLRFNESAKQKCFLLKLFNVKCSQVGKVTVASSQGFSTTEKRVHTHTHRHTLVRPFLLFAFILQLIYTLKSLLHPLNPHFQLNGGLKADRPGNGCTGRKSGPVSRRGSHAGAMLWSDRQ